MKHALHFKVSPLSNEGFEATAVVNVTEHSVITVYSSPESIKLHLNAMVARVAEKLNCPPEAISVVLNGEIYGSVSEIPSFKVEQ